MATRSVTVRLPEELMEWALKQGSMSTVIREALQAYRGGGDRLPETDKPADPKAREEGGVNTHGTPPSATKNGDVRWPEHLYGHPEWCRCIKGCGPAAKLKEARA